MLAGTPAYLEARGHIVRGQGPPRAYGLLPIDRSIVLVGGRWVSICLELPLLHGACPWCCTLLLLLLLLLLLPERLKSNPETQNHKAPQLEHLTLT